MPLQLAWREEFAAPPQRVYAALTDFDAMARWMPGFVGVEKLTDGPVRVGTQFRETRRIMGHNATEHFEVTGVEPGRQFELFVDGTKGSSKRGEYRFRYELAPGGRGTVVTLTGQIGGMGWLMELVGRLFLGPMKKAIAKDLAALRAYVEGGGAA